MRTLWYGALGAVLLASPAYAEQIGFEAWKEKFRAHALSEGISASTLDQALAGLEEDPLVIKLDGKQPEDKITLTKYLKNTVTPGRIRRGRALLSEHHEVLERISARYGVEPQYLLALWGIESDFGRIQGNFSVVRSLATLAHEGRRQAFFTAELLSALRILETESMTPEDLTGSWAGAMGHCQFMPSTYLKYAVDGDGDNRRDIWQNEADTFASIAHYLQGLGWKKGIGWGDAVHGPEKYIPTHEAIKRGKSAKDWHKNGFRFKKKSNALLETDITLYGIYPGSTEQGVFLVTDNYKALLEWNRSRYFATAVGTLADAIGERQ